MEGLKPLIFFLCPCFLDQETKNHRKLVHAMQKGYIGNKTNNNPQTFTTEVWMAPQKNKTLFSGFIPKCSVPEKLKLTVRLRLGEGYDPDHLVIESVSYDEDDLGKDDGRAVKKFPITIKFREVGDLIPRGERGLVLCERVRSSDNPPAYLVALEAPDRSMRDDWLDGLMRVLAEYRRLREEMVEEDDEDSENGDETRDGKGITKVGRGAFDSVMNSARRAKYFAEREVELQTRNAERNKMKEKYIGGGMKYTALAMASRNEENQT